MKKIAFILSAVVITFGIFSYAWAQSVSNPNYWKTNVASSTITPLNTSLQVPCANIVGGCGSGGSGSSTLIYASSGISATASGTNGYIIGNTGVTSFNGATGTVTYSGGGSSTVNLTGSSTPNAILSWLNSNGSVSGTSSAYCFSNGDCTVGTSTDFGIPFAVYSTSTWLNLNASTYTPALSIDGYGDTLTNGVGNYTTSAGHFANYPLTVVTTNSATTGWTTSGTGTFTTETSTSSLYPTPFVNGTAAFSITTGVPGSSYAIKTTSAATTSYANNEIVFWLNFASSTNINTVELFAGSGSGLTNSYEWIVSNLDPVGSPESNYFQSGVWTPITLAFDPNTMTTNGSPNRAAINSYEIKVTDAGTATTTVYANGIAAIPEPKQGVLSFSFDDAYYSEFTNGFSQLSQYGYPATIFDVITNNNNTSTYADNNGGPEFMTTQQLAALQANGWDIACHTYDHPDLTEISSAQLTSELVRCQNWLKSNGLTRASNILAWPFGDYSTTTIQAASPYFVASRGTEGSLFETIPPANPYNLRALQLGDTISSATVESDILGAMQNNEWLILYGHEITNGAATTENQMGSSTFNAIVQYASSIGANVKTIGDVVNGLSGNSAWQDSSAASGTVAAYDSNGNLTTSNSSTLLTAGSAFFTATSTLSGNVIGSANATFNSGTVTANNFVDNNATSTQCDRIDPITGVLESQNCVVSLNNLTGVVVANGTYGISVASGTGNLTFAVSSTFASSTFGSFSIASNTGNAIPMLLQAESKHVFNSISCSDQTAGTSTFAFGVYASITSTNPLYLIATGTAGNNGLFLTSFVSSTIGAGQFYGVSSTVSGTPTVTSCSVISTKQ